MTSIVLDLETTTRCPVGNMSANPMWLGNKIIAAGWKVVGSDGYKYLYDKKSIPEHLVRDFLDNPDLVIGHNVKFDLLYLYRESTEPLPRIWCTQLAAYLLSGQRQLYASLDELTAEYIGKEALKDDKMKAYWKAGVQTEDIPREELLPYLEGDVNNTEAIFIKQFNEAEELGILPLIWTQMDALRATIEMNRNGMCVDWTYVEAQREKYGELLETQRALAARLVPGLDTASPAQLSRYFFGGTEKYQEKELVGQYKNGKDKYKLIDKVRTIPATYPAIGEVGKSGYYSIDDSVLQQLFAKYADKLAGALLVIREYSKIKETYYDGLSSLRFPSGFIYPTLNHCATKTGRLSATNPNLQNQTDAGDVKRAYVSRYGVDGSVVELDYAQLEMVALAYIADDKQLIEDINNGRDMHRELYKEMYGRYPTDKERKPFKRFSFLLVYGGGATTLMAQSGCDRATATKFIKTFYKRYSGVKAYHEAIVAKAEKDAVVSYSESKSGPQYHYYHQSPTGRCFVFQKYVNEYKGGMTFSPTELKNWPIQGFATGDVVPMMVGLLLKALERAKLTPDVKLVMTVHDSVVLDVPNHLLESTAKLAKETLQSAPHYLKLIFDIDFPCKLGVGVESGLNWQDKIELKGI